MAGHSLNDAMGGFFMGQMFAQQTHTPTYNWVAIRFERPIEFVPLLKDVIKGNFFEKPANPDAYFELQFTDKAELRVFNMPKTNKPVMIFPWCFWCWFKKDAYFCIAIRNEMGSPMPQNISLLRSFLMKLQADKIQHEIW